MSVIGVPVRQLYVYVVITVRPIETRSYLLPGNKILEMG